MPADADPTRVAIDVDALEVLESTQTLGEDKPGGDTVDRERGTILTGGDVDAAWYSDTEPLRPEEKERERDEKRWEMDPAGGDASDEEAEIRKRTGAVDERHGLADHAQIARLP